MRSKALMKIRGVVKDGPGVPATPAGAQRLKLAIYWIFDVMSP